MALWNNTFFLAKCGCYCLISLSKCCKTNTMNLTADVLHLLWSWFSLFSPLFGLFFCLWCEVMNLCFIHGYETAQKFCFVALKLLWTLNWNIFTILFARVWANMAPILHTVFSCPNFQIICNIQHFLKCLLCLLFSRQLLITGVWIFFAISGVITSFGWQLWCSS